MSAQPEKKNILKELVELGKQNGQISNQDILDAIGEQDFDPEQLEKLYDAIESQGIKIIEDMGDIKFDDLDLSEDDKNGSDGDPSAP